MDTAKLDALIHYACARYDDPSLLGATKLNKVLWYSDTRAFKALGEPITEATYIKRQFGPVPREVLASRARLVQSGAIVEREAFHHGYKQSQLIALRPADISIFSAEQISLVDEVLEEVCMNHTAASITRETHDRVWEVAEIGEVIPYAALFAGNIGEIDENDIAWAKAEIRKLEVAATQASS